MILRYELEGPSAYNGATLDQESVAGPNHMETDLNGETTWSSGNFKQGINRWRQGSTNGAYVNTADPDNPEFRASVRSSTDRGVPLGVSTIEYAGGTHFNHHPNRLIGHWIVGHGYRDNVAITSFDDPAANAPGLGSEYNLANNDFTYASNVFNGTFVQTHGITWAG